MFEYDHRNRLTVARQFVDENLANEVEYAFDALGHRISRTHGSTTERFVWDGQEIVLDLDGSNNLTFRRAFGPGIDEPIARIEAASNPSWYLTDYQQSVIGIADDAGDLVGVISYDGFGKTLSDTLGPSRDRYSFQAREEDFVTNQRHHRAREADLDLGRWTTEDPKDFAGGDWNLSRFVGNHGTYATDPMGLDELELDGNNNAWWRTRTEGWWDSDGPAYLFGKVKNVPFRDGNNLRNVKVVVPAPESGIRWDGVIRLDLLKAKFERDFRQDYIGTHPEEVQIRAIGEKLRPMAGDFQAVQNSAYVKARMAAEIPLPEQYLTRPTWQNPQARRLDLLHKGQLLLTMGGSTLGGLGLVAEGAATGNPVAIFFGIMMLDYGRVAAMTVETGEGHDTILRQAWYGVGKQLLSDSDARRLSVGVDTTVSAATSIYCLGRSVRWLHQGQNLANYAEVGGGTWHPRTVGAVEGPGFLMFRGSSTWEANGLVFETQAEFVAYQRFLHRIGQGLPSPTSAQTWWLDDALWLSAWREACGMQRSGSALPGTERRAFEWAFHARSGRFIMRTSGEPVDGGWFVYPDRIAGSSTLPGTCGAPRAAEALFGELGNLRVWDGEIVISQGGFRFRPFESGTSLRYVAPCDNCEALIRANPVLRLSRQPRQAGSRAVPGIRSTHPEIPFFPPIEW